jgi:hypothetical protein
MKGVFLMYERKHYLKTALTILLVTAIVVGFFYGLAALNRWSYQRGPTVIGNYDGISGLTPNIEVICNNNNDVHWTYRVDHTTGYVYLVYENGWDFGMATVMEPNGAPMTLDKFLNTR